MAKIDMSAETNEAAVAASLSKKKSGRNTKDLIQSGAFAAIYVVLMLIVVMGSSTLSPILYLVSPLTVGIVTGTVYMLAVLKVRNIIPVIVMGGIFTLVAASSNPISAGLAVLWTVVACVILVVGKFKSKFVYGLSFVAFNLTMTAPFSILLIARDSFLDLMGAYNGQAYRDAFASFAPDGIYFVLIGLAIVGGVIGALIGGKLIDKHFKKAGIV